MDPALLVAIPASLVASSGFAVIVWKGFKQAVHISDTLSEVQTLLDTELKENSGTSMKDHITAIKETVELHVADPNAHSSRSPVRMDDSS